MFTIIVEVEIYRNIMLKEAYTVPDTLFVELKMIFEKVAYLTVEVYDGEFSEDSLEEINGVLSDKEKTLLLKYIQELECYVSTLRGVEWFVGEPNKIF